MSDDSLPALWTSAPPPLNRDAVMRAMNAVLGEDRAARDKNRRIHIAAGLVLALCVPHSFGAPSWHNPARSRRVCTDGHRHDDLGLHRMAVLRLVSASLARTSRHAIATAEERVPPLASGQPDEDGPLVLRASSSAPRSLPPGSTNNAAPQKLMCCGRSSPRRG